MPRRSPAAPTVTVLAASLFLAMALAGCDRRPSPEVPAPSRTDSSPTPDTSPLTPPSQPASPASAP